MVERKKPVNRGMNRPTPKMRAFAKEYVKNENQYGHGNGTQAALKTYNTTDYMTAAMIASANLKKPTVLALIEEEAMTALQDNLEIRKELKETKKDYSVRAKVNFDILDRAGYKPKEEEPDRNINITVLQYGSPAEAAIAVQLSAKTTPTGVPKE